MEKQKVFRRCDGCGQLKDCLITDNIVQSANLDGGDYNRPEWLCVSCLYHHLYLPEHRIEVERRSEVA